MIQPKFVHMQLETCSHLFIVVKDEYFLKIEHATIQDGVVRSIQHKHLEFAAAWENLLIFERRGFKINVKSGFCDMCSDNRTLLDL